MSVFYGRSTFHTSRITWRSDRIQRPIRSFAISFRSTTNTIFFRIFVNSWLSIASMHMASLLAPLLPSSWIRRRRLLYPLKSRCDKNRPFAGAIGTLHRSPFFSSVSFKKSAFKSAAAMHITAPIILRIWLSIKLWPLNFTHTTYRPLWPYTSCICYTARLLRARMAPLSSIVLLSFYVYVLLTTSLHSTQLSIALYIILSLGWTTKG